jgi:hypothetical protein
VNSLCHYLRAAPDVYTGVMAAIWDINLSNKYIGATSETQFKSDRKIKNPGLNQLFALNACPSSYCLYEADRFISTAKVS